MFCGSNFSAHIGDALRDRQVDPMSDIIIDSQSLHMDGLDESTGYSIPNTAAAHTIPASNPNLTPLPSPSPSLPLSRLPFCSSACSRRTAVEIEGAAAVDSGGGGAGIWFRGARIHGIPRLRGCPSRVPGRRPSLLQVLR
jgi:hypothetical protein